MTGSRLSAARHSGYAALHSLIASDTPEAVECTIRRPGVRSESHRRGNDLAASSIPPPFSGAMSTERALGR